MPFVGRLEIRARERYPILIEGHFGDLVWGNSIVGARLDMPISEGWWIRLRGAQKTLPAVIPGLNELDRVLIDDATTTEVMIGITAMPY